MKIIIIIAFVFLNFQFVKAEKYALIIAIGDYPSSSNWNSISSINDVPLIEQALLNQSFKKENIRVLRDSDATFVGINAALKELLSIIKSDDIVVIHYSGHGQQVFDDNGDEADGLDEALVPYDAFAIYSTEYYGQNHLRDDQIEQIINNFRNKLGLNGQLLMVFDSCHSGSATRGGKARGGVGALVPADWSAGQSVANKSIVSGLFDKTKLLDEPASFVLLSGASANELNFEYQGKGSLSYAFSKAMSQLGANFTYRQLFASIRAEMNVIAPNQNPVIEGDLDYKLFKGEYKAQQPYFEVKKVTRFNVLQIPAGKLQQVFEGTTIFVLPAGTTEVTPDKILAKGEVTLARYNEAVIKLDKDLANNNNLNYWVFIDKPSYGDIAVKVFIDKTANSPEIVKGITSFLAENKLGSVVKEQDLSDISILKTNDAFEFAVTNDLAIIDKAELSRGISALDDLTQKIFQFAQGQYLKGLQMKNPAYEFSFRLLPVEYDHAIQEIAEIKEPVLDESQIFKVKPEQDFVVLEVTNSGTEPIYFSIIEINTQGAVAPFMPNAASCKLNDQERIVAPGKTVVFKRCVFEFYPPYEKLMLKGFASPTPLNFETTATTRGSKNANANPLEKFLSQSYQRTRGSGGNQVTDKIDAYSFEFIYEIVK